MTSSHLERLNDTADQVSVGDGAGGPRIDWEQIDAYAEPLAETGRSLPDAGESADRPALDDHTGRIVDDPRLLSVRDTETLDPARRGVPVAELHADRLSPPTDAEQRMIREGFARDGRPESWIWLTNQDFVVDAGSARPGHIENCADCARAVQATWEGNPTAAGSISADGLPLRDTPEPAVPGGEHLAYTEQWAGRHSVEASYDEIGRRVADSRGSAIVFAQGDGGHAFNAIWDPDRHRVIWADGQVGRIGDWPPTKLSEQMPDTRAIFFEQPRRFR